MRLLAIVGLFAGIVLGQAHAQGANSWMRDYRDASLLVERARQSGSDRGMREVVALTTALADQAKASFPESSKMTCVFAALNLGSVARSLRDNQLIAVEREHRLWKSVDEKCRNALR